MNITTEQMEKVCRFASVTPEEARAALEQTDGSPLDAVLLLERQGKCRPTRGGSWTTRAGPSPEEPATSPPALKKRGSLPARKERREGSRRRITLEDVLEALKSLVRNCTRITIDVWRKDDLLVGIPLIICVLLFIVAYYVMIPLTVVGLVLGCRYHISGWDFGEKAINRTMDQVADVVNDLSSQVWHEMKDYHDRHESKK